MPVVTKSAHMIVKYWNCASVTWRCKFLHVIISATFNANQTLVKSYKSDFGVTLSLSFYHIFFLRLLGCEKKTVFLVIKHQFVF